jgi:hypothetical protein
MLVTLTDYDDDDDGDDDNDKIHYAVSSLKR